MNHLSQIAAQLSKYELDAMLITSEPGERYALGFHGEGMIIVTPDTVHYSTDGRYIEAAQAQVTGAKIHCTTTERGHLVLAEEFIKANGLKKVGFESSYMDVDTYHRYADKLPCLLVPAKDLLGELRASKDAEELAAMRQAQKITDAVFQEMLTFIKPGMTEREVAAYLVYQLLLHGGEKTSFDPIVAAGANGSKPHAVPGDTVIEPGMFVTLDFGCVYNGYCSDMTRTIAVGEPSEEMKQVYDIVLQAQLAGISAARAGATGREVDRAARQIIQDVGYGAYFNHGFGHSLGLEIHEAPNASSINQNPFPAGAVISAEPGIYLPGKFGVRIEDVLILTENGCENITNSPKELLVI